MPKRASEKKSSASKKVNVEIAPGNRSRLEDFIKTYRDDPDRSRPSMTLTDVLNAALDEYFAALAASRGGEIKRR